MKYAVTGADQDTGEDIELTVEAATPADAQEFANRKGIMVANVRPMTTPAAKIPQIRPAPPASLEQGHFHGAPVLNVAMPRRGSSMGVASIILGVLAFLICWIPLANLISVPLSAVGLLLGLIGIIVALTRRGSGIGFPIAGTMINGLALIIVIGMVGAAAGVLREAAAQASQAAAESRAAARSAPATGDTSDNSSKALPVWIPANTPIQQGDLKIQVVKARVGKVEIEAIRGKRESARAMLAVEIEIENTSRTRKIDYHSSRGSAGTVMSDNFENKYRPIDLSFGDRPVGSVFVEALYPGASVQDILLFEIPVDQAEFLHLEIPAAFLDGEGRVRIEIPASMIER